ncbi:thioesterase II family protein [Bacillus thuringiensis]|uniref:thioesterase II family protein n=1 Tax=Bacillus TaxID=1386 RepID=UPI000BF7533A|nr:MULTISPECIES: thioesterase domain-containing protein [Bacillus cereus group]MBV6708158.1 thioesterase II family protein [Bacillus thuringiensis]PFL80254.1 putative thioesterase [Bacillus cereus]PFN66214.1 putative thioesterase [Bacillus cereus]
MSINKNSFYYYKPQKKPLVRLLCFPYAGGSALAYRQWNQILAEEVEVCPVQLPGRENRLAEEPIRSLPTLISFLADELEPVLNSPIPYAFFGHSMGALISYELAIEMKKRSWQMPIRLFLSGKSSPQVSKRETPTYNLPKKEFIEELRKMNGTPEEVLDNHEIMDLFLPILRADFELVDNYQYEKSSMLSCPITVFGGIDDPSIKTEELKHWKELTTNHFNMHLFPGDHFFIYENEKKLLKVVNEELTYKFQKTR